MKRMDFRASTEKVGPIKVLAPPTVVDVESLKKMNEANPTLLIIGENETVTNPEGAVKTAKAAGIQVKLWKDAGHFMYAEHPQDPVHALDSFLQGDSASSS